MPDPTTADNLPRTLATPATENPLAIATGHTANEGQLDEFDYFTQTVKPGAYFPGLPEYIEHEGNNFAANILPDSGNTLTFGTHRKVSSGVAQDGKPQYLSVRHNELARAQGRIDEKYDARMMINDQTGALTLTLILRDTAPADLERADLLIDYFSKSFGGRNLPIIVAYGNIHGEERYEGTLHSYQQERSRGEVKRTPIEKLTPKPRRPLA